MFLGIWIILSQMTFYVVCFPYKESRCVTINGKFSNWSPPISLARFRFSVLRCAYFRSRTEDAFFEKSEATSFKSSNYETNWPHQGSSLKWRHRTRQRWAILLCRYVTGTKTKYSSLVDNVLVSVLWHFPLRFISELLSFSTQLFSYQRGKGMN